MTFNNYNIFVFQQNFHVFHEPDFQNSVPYAATRDSVNESVSRQIQTDSSRVVDKFKCVLFIMKCHMLPAVHSCDSFSL